MSTRPSVTSTSSSSSSSASSAIAPPTSSSSSSSVASEKKGKQENRNVSPLPHHQFHFTHSISLPTPAPADYGNAVKNAMKRNAPIVDETARDFVVASGLSQALQTGMATLFQDGVGQLVQSSPAFVQLQNAAGIAAGAGTTVGGIPKAAISEQPGQTGRSDFSPRASTPMLPLTVRDVYDMVAKAIETFGKEQGHLYPEVGYFYFSFLVFFSPRWCAYVSFVLSLSFVPATAQILGLAGRAVQRQHEPLPPLAPQRAVAEESRAHAAAALAVWRPARRGAASLGSRGQQHQSCAAAAAPSLCYFLLGARSSGSCSSSSSTACLVAPAPPCRRRV